LGIGWNKIRWAFNHRLENLHLFFLGKENAHSSGPTVQIKKSHGSILVILPHTSRVSGPKKKLGLDIHML